MNFKNRVAKIANKRILWIILLVLATIVLVANLVLLKAAPSTNSMNAQMGNFSAEGFNPGSVPQGGGNFDPGNLPTDENGNFDMSKLPDMSGSGTANVSNPLSGLRKAAIPIAVVCILLDILSIIMLIRIRRSRKDDEEDDTPEVAVIEETGKRKRKTWWWMPVALILTFAIVVNQMSGFFRSKSVTSVVEEKVLEENAEKSDIDSVLVTGGSISDSDDSEVSLPSNVKITSILVKNGDTVSKGDAIAEIDKTSALLAITKVQNLMDELDEELEKARDEEIEDTVEATAAGRVKAVNVEEGDNILDVMYEDKALIRISLDGQMAVDIETKKDVSVSDTVTVKTSDGTSYTGKVSARTDSSITVTLTDEGPEYGDSVTVTADDEGTLGEGSLYIHSEQTVLGYVGTVKSVKVSEGEKVSAGETLMTLTDTGYSATYEALLTQRHTLEDQISDLFAMYETGTIVADSDGMISGLDESKYKDVMADQSNADNVTKLAAVMNTSANISSEKADIKSMTTTLCLVTTRGSSNSATLYLSSVSDETETETPETETPETKTPETETPETETPETEASETEAPETEAPETKAPETETPETKVPETKVPETEKPTGDDVIPPGDTPTGDDVTPPGDIPSGDDVTPPGDTPTGDDVTPPGEDVPDGQGPVAESGDTNKTAMVAVVRGSQVKVLISSGTVKISDYTKLPDIDPMSMTSVTTLTVSDSTPIYRYSGSGWQKISTSSLTAGTNIVVTYDKNGKIKWIIAEGSGGGAPTGGGDIPSGDDVPTGGEDTPTGGTGEMPSATTGMGDTITIGGTTDLSTAETAEAEKTASSYAYEESQLCSVTPQDHVTVEITVDELDILSLSVGDTAMITLDALVGQSFEGTLTSINPAGTNSGGNTKYTALVTMDRTESMLTGMNATVQFTQDTKKDVLRIPVAALEESGNSVYVYTSYDEKSDTLGDPVEVKTGVSDGTYVEILEGIEEGDAYYYRYADTIKWAF